MTKSELKEIIKECILEINESAVVEESVDINSVNEDSHVMESAEYDAYCIAEARAYIEAAMKNDEETLNEGNSFENLGTLTKALKEAKASTKEAKSLIKEGKNKEAKNKIDDAIKNLKNVSCSESSSEPPSFSAVSIVPKRNAVIHTQNMTFFIYAYLLFPYIFCTCQMPHRECAASEARRFRAAPSRSKLSAAACNQDVRSFL